MLRCSIKRRNIFVFFPASAEEDFTVLLGNLFQRLQTIRSKARAHHLNMTHAFFSEHFQRFVGIRHQPGFPAKARLKGHHHFFRCHLQCGSEFASCCAATLRVIIAFICITLGNAMIREQQQIRFAMFGKRSTYAVRQCINIIVVIGVITNKRYPRNATFARQNSRQFIPYRTDR